MVLINSVSKAFGYPAWFSAELSCSHPSLLRPDSTPEKYKRPDQAAKPGRGGGAVQDATVPSLCSPGADGEAVHLSSPRAARHLG